MELSPIQDEEKRSVQIEEQRPVQAEPDGPIEAFITGSKLYAVISALMLGVFMMALDNYIIATAIPSIETEFAQLNTVGWMGSAYLLTQMSLQPTFGKIYSYFPVKWIYMAAILIFELGSVIIATANGPAMFILGRAIAGSGAAGLFSGSLIVIGRVIALQNRPFYIGLVTSMYGVASVAGPLLGGLFTDSAQLRWRFCFWFNLPFGSIALLLVSLLLPLLGHATSKLTLKEKLRQLDLLGAMLLVSGIVCLLLALEWGGNQYPWSDSRVWGCMIGFALIIGLFVLLQIHKKSEATIPGRILFQRTVYISCAFSAMLSIATSAHTFYLPVYFQVVQGTDAQTSGVRILPYLLSDTGLTVINGSFMTLIGYYAPSMLLGGGLKLAGAVCLQTLQVSSSTSQWVGYQILAGLGSGFAVQTPFIATQAVLVPEDLPSGMGMVGFFNAFGSCVSISIAQNIFSGSLVSSLDRVPGLDSGAALVNGLADVRTSVPPALVATVIEDYAAALQAAFILPVATAAAGLLCCSFVPWKKIKS